MTAEPWRETIQWATARARCLADAPPLYPALVHPGERRALYARELMRNFATDQQLAGRIARFAVDNRSMFADLVSAQGMWDGRSQALGDAIILGYGGFTRLDAVLTFGNELVLCRPDVSSRLLRECSEILVCAGLNAPWASAAVIAAILHHCVWELLSPPWLAPRRLHLWPVSGRTELSAPEVVVLPGYDPTRDTHSRAYQWAVRAYSKRARATERRLLGVGYKTFRDGARIERDTRVAYLRLSDPGRWTWNKLVELKAEELEPGEFDLDDLQSVGAVRAAVERVVSLLAIERAKGSPGRPRHRR